MNVSTFKPQEVAFRKPGRTWKRRVVTTQAAFDVLLARLADEAAAVEIRDAD